MIAKDLEAWTHAVHEFPSHALAVLAANEMTFPEDRVFACAFGTQSLESLQVSHSSWFIGERVGCV